MEIGVADAAEEDFELHVVLARIAPRDRGGSERRSRAVCGIGLGFEHRWVLL